MTTNCGPQQTHRQMPLLRSELAVKKVVNNLKVISDTLLSQIGCCQICYLPLSRSLKMSVVEHSLIMREVPGSIPFLQQQKESWSYNDTWLRDPRVTT